ncbi:MAG TPA: hypothetical protein VFP12_10865 [Allosphingosinicella sp.]|nr:hypothetical protein [Allosphingosinicella sp.]
MSKRNAALAGAFCLLLLPSCGSREPESAQNAAVAPGATAPGTAAPAGPPPPGASTNGLADPVPPPDAVSHPDGYLPPAPAEPGAGNSGSDPSPPATEDEYLRNRQESR